MSEPTKCVACGEPGGTMIKSKLGLVHKDEDECARVTALAEQTRWMAEKLNSLAPAQKEKFKKELLEKFGRRRR